jgi:hypothetical protein
MKTARDATTARQLRPLLGYLLAILVAASLPASAAEVPAPGVVFHGHVDLAGTQIVLPEGDWVVAGRASEAAPGVEGVPYGTLESIVLFRLAEQPAAGVAAFVIARSNAIAIEDGWGVAPECERTDLLLSVVYDESEGHGFCGFVTHVLNAVDDSSDRAWQQAVIYAKAKGLALPATWLMAGFRLANLADMLDVRYNFNPELQGMAPSTARSWADSEWSRAEIFGADSDAGSRSTIASLFDRLAFWRPAAPAREPSASAATQRRADLVDDLKEWLARMRYPVELGFDNRAAALSPPPLPWPAASGTPLTELAVRLALLDQLRNRNILDQAEYLRQRSVAESFSEVGAGRRWTAEELTFAKTATDQVPAAIIYFGADLLYTGNVLLSSQLWTLDQALDLARYSAQEYLWQRLGPRKLDVNSVLTLPAAGIDG